MAAACHSNVDAAGPNNDRPEAELDPTWRALDPYTARVDQPHGRAQPDGLTTLWFPEGGKSGEGNFVLGEKDGPWTFWHPNGSVRWRGTFANGVPTGDECAWYDTGQV